MFGMERYSYTYGNTSPIAYLYWNRLLPTSIGKSDTTSHFSISTDTSNTFQKIRGNKTDSQ